MAMLSSTDFAVWWDLHLFIRNTFFLSRLLKWVSVQHSNRTECFDRLWDKNWNRHNARTLNFRFWISQTATRKIDSTYLRLIEKDLIYILSSQIFSPWKQKREKCWVIEASRKYLEKESFLGHPEIPIPQFSQVASLGFFVVGWDGLWAIVQFRGLSDPS